MSDSQGAGVPAGLEISFDGGEGRVCDRCRDPLPDRVLFAVLAGRLLCDPCAASV